MLLRGLARAWPLREAWRRRAFERRFGGLAVEASEIPYARGFGSASTHLELGAYMRLTLLCTPALARGAAVPTERQAAASVDAAFCARLWGANASAATRVGAADGEAAGGEVSEGGKREEEEGEAGGLYVFNRIDRAPQAADGLGALAADMTALPWFLQSRLPVTAAAGSGAVIPGPELSLSRAPAPQFYLGGPGTGAPQHYGQDSFNVLAWGRKQWVFRPSAEAEYSTVPAARFFRDVLPREERELGRRALRCTQEGGDIMVVGNGWGHSVLNLQTSVGMYPRQSPATAPNPPANSP